MDELLSQLAASIAEIKRLMAESRVAYFDELIARGFKPRGAYLATCRRAGYL